MSKPRVRNDLSDQQIIDRAVSMIGRKDIHYNMKAGRNGGRDPYAPSPVSQGTNTADCVGFAFWAFGLDRYQPDFVYGSYEGWINTNSMIGDALTKRSYFLPMVELVYPHFLVYPSSNKVELAQGFPPVGHVGVVINEFKVVHCSHGNDERLGHAIDVGRPRSWTSKPRHMRLVLNPIVRLPKAPDRPPLPAALSRPKLKT